jgi:hypothetical protein
MHKKGMKIRSTLSTLQRAKTSICCCFFQKFSVGARLLDDERSVAVGTSLPVHGHLFRSTTGVLEITWYGQARSGNRIRAIVVHSKMQSKHLR